jgi:hypothetical protein
MIILLNGAFGVGKSAVAHCLAKQLPGASIFDPEWLGFLLQRLAFRTVDDFQDLACWRRGTVAGIRFLRRFRPTVVVPMAFSNEAYLSEVRDGVGRSDRQVLHFCLMAPLPVILQRLEQRSVGSPASLAWQRRRAAECCLAHQSAFFREHIPTDGLSPQAVAQALVQRIRQGQPQGGAA